MTYHASNGDTVGWVSGWSAVEVVLLDVYTVDGSAGDGDVLVGDVGNVASRVRLYRRQLKPALRGSLLPQNSH